jgi:hypothetical protein
MTEVEQSVQEAAERIAARGRDALVERLREAYREAAAAHADIVKMDPERIEELVQRSADRADGLQWRRALAGVAMEELGIGLIEALSHPAVARAQEMVGAPSYEESLAELTRNAPAPNGDTAAQAEPEPQDAHAPEPEAVEEAEPGEESAGVDDEEPEAEAVVPEPVADGEADGTFDESFESSESFEPAADDDEAEEATDRLRVTAIHLGGVANLPTSAEGIDLILSEDGLDIMRNDDEILGRLVWGEIDALEVPAARGRRRRRNSRARLVVRTRHGDASFEIPAFSSDELRRRVDPLVARFGRG